MSDLEQALKAAAPQHTSAADVAALWRRGRKLRRRRAAGSVLGAVAVLGMLGLGSQALLRPAVQLQGVASPPSHPELDLSVLERPEGPHDQVPEPFDEGNVVTVRLARQHGDVKVYVYTTADEHLCLAVEDHSGGQVCIGVEVYRQQGAPPVLWPTADGSALAALVPDGFTTARTDDEEWMIENNVLLILPPGRLPPVVELTGPAGARTLALSAAVGPLPEPGPAERALDGRCDLQSPPWPDLHPGPIDPPRGGVTVTAVAPAGFTAWIPPAGQGTGFYGPMIGWEEHVTLSDGHRFVHPDGRSIVVAAVTGDHAALCATMRKAARELDAGRRGDVIEVRHNHVAVRGGGNFLLWLETDTVMLQVLGHDVDQGLLVEIADTLEVHGLHP
jgi:hypothetical protein